MTRTDPARGSSRRFERLWRQRVVLRGAAATVGGVLFMVSCLMVLITSSCTLQNVEATKQTPATK
jgi:hypothetical protein